MAWWNRKMTGCLGCQAKDQELSRLRSCAGCKAQAEHIKDLQVQMVAMRHAWNVERQEYKTAIDRLLTKEGQEPVGAIVASQTSAGHEFPDRQSSIWDEREPSRA